VEDDKRQLTSYVWHKGQCYFVSTIERDSSANVPPVPRFMETIAWEYDWDARQRGSMVATEGSGSAVSQHFEMCQQLHRNGCYESKDDSVL